MFRGLAFLIAIALVNGSLTGNHMIDYNTFAVILMINMALVIVVAFIVGSGYKGPEGAPGHPGAGVAILGWILVPVFSALGAVGPFGLILIIALIILLGSMVSVFF